METKIFKKGDRVEVTGRITYDEVTFLPFETIYWTGTILAVHEKIIKFHNGIVYCVKLEHPKFPGFDFEVLVPAYNTKLSPSGYPYPNFLQQTQFNEIIK